MTIESLVREYLSKINIMQLATSVGDQPWLCTVHYYHDKTLNLYWCSLPARRHSEEISRNSQAAAYVLVHENTPDEDYVTGMTITGHAELIGPKIDREVFELYAKKHNESDKFVKAVINDESPYKFYRLKPNKITLFDNKNFPNDPRQEWDLA